MKLKKAGLTLIFLLLIGTMGTGILYLLFKAQTRYSQSPKRFPELPESEEWSVISVHDGDTIKAQKDAITSSFRLCGIDANEINQDGGRESRDYLRTLLGMPKASLISPKNVVQIYVVGTDKYGRKIGEVFVPSPDGTSKEKFINEEIVKAGFARAYTKYINSCPNKIAITNAEAIAKQNLAGVWANPNSIPPWEWRRKSQKRSN